MASDGLTARSFPAHSILLTPSTLLRPSHRIHRFELQIIRDDDPSVIGKLRKIIVSTFTVSGSLTPDTCDCIGVDIVEQLPMYAHLQGSSGNAPGG